MKNLNPIYLLTEGNSNDIIAKIANAIYNKYPTFNDLVEGCENAQMKTGNKVFIKIPEMVKSKMRLIVCYHPELADDPDGIYYNGIYNLVLNHKQGRVALLTILGMIGGTGLGAAAGAGLSDGNEIGALIGGHVGFWSGLIGGGMAADRGISKRSLNKMYDAYQKDDDVDNMLSKI